MRHTQWAAFVYPEAMSELALNEIIAHRWSPRSFLPRPIEPEKVRAIFEAARWSASCNNEQPWRFVIATRDHPVEFARLLGVLVEKNQAWAKNAGLLGITTGKRTFTFNGSPNRFNMHDAGMALKSIMLQSTAMGLQAHGMGGFDAGRARTEFAIPDDFEVGAAFAVGYVDGPFDPPAGRTRLPLDAQVFAGTWGAPARIE
jgi:nitroreductase